jgi:hypothetical protein
LLGALSLTAFLAFLQTFSIWLYLLCALGILFGIKLLGDARRLARSTLFSLDHERANEQSFRALVLIVFMVVAASTVAFANAVLPELVPRQDGVILGRATPTLAALVFPTNTLIPSPTPTLRPTETPFGTSTMVPATPTRAASVKPAASPVAPTTVPPPLPAPMLDPKGPMWNGVVMTGVDQDKISIKFQWTWDCAQCRLGPEDRFVVMISYLDRATDAPKVLAGTTKNNLLSMIEITRGAGVEVYQQAKEDKFQWYVQVRRGDLALTPPSDKWNFIWH